MKACSILVVSAAIFTAKVHAASFSKKEYFDDASCTAANLKKVDYDVEDCTGPNSDDGDVYYTKITCTATTRTRTFHTDSECSDVHPNKTADNPTTLACTPEEPGLRYRKITCEAETAVAMVHESFPSGDSDCSETPTGTHLFMLQSCSPSFEYESGNWTESWTSVVLAGTTLNHTDHTTSDCSDTGVLNEGSPWTCGQCTLVEGSYRKITCPAPAPTTGGTASGAPRCASPGPLLAAAAAAALMLTAASAA